MRIAKHLQRWQEAGLLDQTTVAKILDYEKANGGRRFAYALYGIGALAILLGIAAVIGVNWYSIPASVKLGVHFLINGFFAALIFCLLRQGKKGILVELLLAALAGLTLTSIALIGQAYQSQEPTWKALLLWLVLASPFLFVLAESRFVIAAWIVSFFTTYCFFLSDDWGKFADLTKVFFIALVPYVMIAAGQSAFFRNLREKWATTISYAGFVVVVGEVSLSQFAWRTTTSELYSDFYSTAFSSGGDVFLEAMLVTFLVAFAIVLARRIKWLVPMPKPVDLLLLLSVFVGFLPYLVPHAGMPITGAAIAMLYWGYCGWAGLSAGYPRALDIAVSLIALRLFGVYIEVFGSLLQTGVGLIVSGVVLIALVVATRRISVLMRPVIGRQSS